MTIDDPAAGRVVRRILRSLLIMIALLGAALVTYVHGEFTWIPSLRETVSEIDSLTSEQAGQLLFETRGCVGCHSIDPGADLAAAPNLVLVVPTMTDQEIIESIKYPRKRHSTSCAGGECPRNDMPLYAEILSDEQVRQLLVYLRSLERLTSEDE